MLIWPPHCLVQTDRPVVSLYIVGRSLGFSAVPGSFRKLLTICVGTDLAYLWPVDKWIYCEDCISFYLPGDRPELASQGNGTIIHRQNAYMHLSVLVDWYRGAGHNPQPGGINQRKEKLVTWLPTTLHLATTLRLTPPARRCLTPSATFQLDPV